VLALGLGALAVLASGCDVEFLRTQRENELKQKPAIQLPPSVLAPSPAPPSQVVPPAGAPRSFADLAAQADPAVVFVRTVIAQRVGFQRRVGQGSGSGFIFDASGLILTNSHVVEGTVEVRGAGDPISVELSDGRTFRAELVGRDPLTDVAVLRIPAAGLPVLPLGDSDVVRVGDWVLAIGNPVGLAHTVSAGIISARDRTGEDVDLSDARSYFNFLQTDASINPGNSGGPMIDLQGRAIGINTAIRADATGIGFAIPINMVREILPRLVKDGVIQRSIICVQAGPVSNDQGLRDRGALVAVVMKDGPAHHAGFQPGDIVVELDGKAVENPEALRWRASLAPSGLPVPVVVLRNAQRLTLELTPWPISRSCDSRRQRGG